jgi:pyruvyl transferase EpsO
MTARLILPEPASAARAQTLIATIHSALAQALTPELPTALLDFPAHSNVGDSAIWAGQILALRQANHDLRYVCAMDSFNEAALRSRMPFGQILLHGGGNFGTLWPRYQAFREAILQRFADYRVVQLPQSLHFGDAAAQARTRQRLIAHPDFVLMVRDRRSESIGRDLLAVRTILCPDSALLLHGSLRRQPACVDVLVLARTDKEAGTNALAQFALPGHRVECIDWLVEESTPSIRLGAMMMRVGRTPLAGWHRTQQIMRRSLAALAWSRVQRGVSLLSRGRVVVTDRLHGHIVCMLLGIPHVVLDNSNGKIFEFIQCWHQGDPLLRCASTLDEAQREAQSLLNLPSPAAA